MTADYPPAQHVLRDLCFTTTIEDEGAGRVHLPVAAELADATGSVRIGVLATLADIVSGGIVGRAVAPNWMATADLSVFAGDPIPVAAGGTVTAVGRLLRAGRTTAVVEIDLTHDDRPIGIGTTTFAVLERRASNPTINGVTEGVVQRFSGSDGLPAPLLDAIGVRTRADDPRSVEVGVSSYVVNTLGAVQGGVVSMILEAGAAAGLAASHPVRVTHLEMNYLSLMKVGPVRTTTRVLLDTPERAVVEVRAVDHGNGDRLTTVARAALIPEVAR